MRTMRWLTVGVLAAALALQAGAPVPRPAAELVVVEPGGKKITLESMKGKVVVVQFLLTTCPHCQAFSRSLTKMATELGPKFQAVGVAFDVDDAKNVPTYVKSLGTNFPVGSVEKMGALKFLAVSVTDYNRLRVPQVVVIDKKGMVRSQTELTGAGPAGNEATLRTLVANLMKE